MSVMGNYPVRIKECPIVEARVDINCSFAKPSQAMVGLLYAILLEVCEVSELPISNLPILQIPEEIRSNDPNLQQQPTHSILCDGKGEVQIGSNGLSFIFALPYTNWKNMSQFVFETMALLEAGHLMSKVRYVSVRYLDFFKCDIYKHIKLKVSMRGEDIDTSYAIFKNRIKKNDVDIVTQITSGVHVKNVNLKIDHDGSLIDISTIVQTDGEVKIQKALDLCHDVNKKCFFDMLEEHFIEQLNPEYNE